MKIKFDIKEIIKNVIDREVVFWVQFFWGEGGNFLGTIFQETIFWGPFFLETKFK